MQVSKLARGIALGFGVTLACAAYASDTSNMTVQASVAGDCKITATPTLDFGSLDPASASAGAGTSNIAFWCTKGVSYTLSADNGLHFSGSRRMLGPGASDLMPYSLSLAANATGTGSGKSTTITVVATGGVLNSAYINATVGAYSDTVQISVTP